MTPWLAVIVASLAVYSWKFIGYLLPHSILNSKTLSRTAGFITIALLSALVGIQTFVSNREIVFDGRVVALIAAAILLRLKVPFIGVVVIAAAIAAAFRLAF